MLNILEKLKTGFDPDEYKVGGGVSDEQISAAEKNLNLKFPDVYKDFLSEVGWLEICNVYFFGVSLQSNAEGSVTRMTQFAQANWNLPCNFIVVYSSADKLLWCMECSASHLSKIRGYDTDKQRFISVVSEDFEALINNYLDQ